MQRFWARAGMGGHVRVCGGPCSKQRSDVHGGRGAKDGSARQELDSTSRVASRSSKPEDVPNSSGVRLVGHADERSRDGCSADAECEWRLGVQPMRPRKLSIHKGKVECPKEEGTTWELRKEPRLERTRKHARKGPVRRKGKVLPPEIIPPKVTCKAYLEGPGCLHRDACPYFHPKISGRCRLLC